MSPCPPECLGCATCISGSERCSACGLLSTSLTAECPGELLGGDEIDAVYYGKANHVAGNWVVKMELSCPLSLGKEELLAEWRGWSTAERELYKKWLEFVRYSEASELEAANFAAYMVVRARQADAWLLKPSRKPCQPHGDATLYCGKCGYLRKDEGT